MGFEMFIALCGVIGIAWLTIVPTYRGWKPLNKQMAERVETTIAVLGDAAEADDDGRLRKPQSE